MDCLKKLDIRWYLITHQLVKSIGSFTNFPAKRGCGAVTINTHGNVMLWFSKRDFSELSGEGVWLRLKIIILRFRNLPNKKRNFWKATVTFNLYHFSKSQGICFHSIWQSYQPNFVSVTHIAIHAHTYICTYVYLTGPFFLNFLILF